MRAAILRQVYRLGWCLLWALSFVYTPRGGGAKCLLTSAGAVLLVRHSYGHYEWEVPGGGSRRGEEPGATMRREVREELAVAVGAAESLGVCRGSGRYARVRVTLFTAELADRAAVRRDPVEIAEVAWFDPAAPPAPLGWFAAEALARYREALASRASDPGSPAWG